MHNGQYRCINIGSTATSPDMDTARIETCVEWFGSQAKLLALPENETELWNLVNETWTSA